MGRPAWVNHYVGIPFADNGRTAAGCDCYGLIRLVLAEQFGIDLDAYEARYADTGDRAGITTVVEEREAVGWVRLYQGPYAAGMVALFRLQGLPVHVGVLINAVDMLHVVRGSNAVIQPMGAPIWARRLEGVYRFVA